MFHKQIAVCLAFDLWWFMGCITWPYFYNWNWS